MKRFLLIGFAAVMLGNSVVAMNVQVKKKPKNKSLYFSHLSSGGTAAVNENGSVVSHNRIEVVRHAINPEPILLGLLGATGLLTSVYEGSFTGCVFSALTMVNAAKEFQKHMVRVKRYQDNTLVANIAITGEPVVLERAIAVEQAAVDALNEEPKIKKSPHLSPDGGLNLVADIVAEQEKDGLVA